MKKMIVFLAVLTVSILLLGCTGIEDTNQDREKVEVIASFYPLYDIAKNVAGEKANVNVLVPPANEPHSFEPSPGDILQVSRADLIIVTGTEFEEWEERIVDNVNPNAKMINASKGIELILTGEEHHHNHEEGENDQQHKDEIHDEDNEIDEEHHEDENIHSHGIYDPHFWVSPLNAIQITENILEALVEMDPENKEYYLKNAQEYKLKLSELDNSFKAGLATCEKEEIITTHAAFAYLGKDYGFEQITILGLSPDSEPTVNQIANLIEEAEFHRLNYIFYEEMVDPRVSNTIAQEIGAQTLVLNPVAGSKDEKDYIEIMTQNLDNLIMGLECN